MTHKRLPLLPLPHISFSSTTVLRYGIVLPQRLDIRTEPVTALGIRNHLKDRTLLALVTIPILLDNGNDPLACPDVRPLLEIDQGV